jgi:hypothetical protein
VKKIKFSFLGIFMVVVFLATSASGQAQREVVERLPQGEINWTQGKVTAKGSGVPPTGVTLSQARIMAERAAKADALRNLLEAVKGVRVDAETTVESFTTKSDRVMTRVSGIVIGAREVGKRYLSDGSVEITMEINLTGELLAVMLQELPPLAMPLMPTPSLPPIQKPAPPSTKPSPVVPPVQKPSPPSPPPQETKVIPPVAKPALPPPTPPEIKVTPPSAEEKKAPATPEVQAKVEEQLDLKKLEYTGLIVDARKLNLRPALIPKILNQKGELVYSQQSVDQKDLIKMGLVGYAKDVDAAAKNQRVTAEPYVIPGMNATGEKKTDVVISNRDAQIVLTTAPYTGYLKNGRVMIVYD